jgi:hypothetical protein
MVCVCVNFWVHASLGWRIAAATAPCACSILNFAAVAATNNGAQSLFAQQKEEWADAAAALGKKLSPPAFKVRESMRERATGNQANRGLGARWGPPTRLLYAPIPVGSIQPALLIKKSRAGCMCMYTGVLRRLSSTNVCKAAQKRGRISEVERGCYPLCCYGILAKLDDVQREQATARGSS